MEITINVKIDKLEIIADAINRLADALNGSKPEQRAVLPQPGSNQPAGSRATEMPQTAAINQAGMTPQVSAMQMPSNVSPVPAEPGHPAAVGQLPQMQQQSAVPLMPPQYQTGYAPAAMPPSGLPAAPQGTIPIMPQSTPAVAGLQPPPGAAAPIPTTHVAQAYTQEQLAVAMTSLVDAGKVPLIQSILQQFGVPALTEIPPQCYPELAVKLREAGAPI